MDVGVAVPSDAQAAEVVQPREAALEDPAPAAEPEPCSVPRRAMTVRAQSARRYLSRS